MTTPRYIPFFENFRRLAKSLADDEYQLTNWVYNGKPSHDMEDDLDDFGELFGVGPRDASDSVVRWRFEFGEELMLSSVLVAARIFTLFPGKLAAVDDIMGILRSDDMQAVRDAALQLVAAIDDRIATHGLDLPTSGSTGSA